MEDEGFRYGWRERFPQLDPPQPGNTWLVLAAAQYSSLSVLPRLLGQPKAPGLVGMLAPDAGWKRRCGAILVNCDE
jgi:hypothetical protein